MKVPASFIFQSVVSFLFFLINVLALYLLLRGHNLPGGGFIAGLASAISLVLLSMGVGLQAMHTLMRFDPARLAVFGLLISALTGASPMLFGDVFLAHHHVSLKNVPLIGYLHIGTPLLFDLGVYLVVVGITCKIIFTLAKSTQGLGALVEQEERRYSSAREKALEDDCTDDVLPPIPSREGSSC